MTPDTLPRLADVTAVVKAEHALKDIEEKSLDYVRFLGCMLTAENAPLMAADIFAQRYPLDVADTLDPRKRNAWRDRIALVDKAAKDLSTKAATFAGTTTDATWAGPLAPIEPLAAAFLAYVRPLTILGKLPALRRVPPNVSVALQTGGGAYAWIGQNAVTPVSFMAFATTTLGIAKCAGLVVITDELVRNSSPDATVIVRNDLAEGIAAFTDVNFIDPSKAPVAGASPGSITNGVTPIAPTGTTAAALVKDVGALIAQILINNPDPSAVTLVMHPQYAIMLAGTMTPMAPTVTKDGGWYGGVPVVTSANAGTAIVAVNQAAILYADNGIEVTTSKNATIEMNTAPTDPPVAATVLTSLWQMNLIGFKADRHIVWKKATATSVSLISPAGYVPGT